MRFREMDGNRSIMRINRKSAELASEGDMTPMIDMTFQLIAFFMVLLNFSDVEQDQRINLPASELARPPEVAYQEPLTVQMTADDTILFAGDELTVDDLQSALLREAQIIKAHPNKTAADVTVIIRADQLARTGRVQEVIQMCQKAEFDTFALRGRQSDSPTLTEP
jgi:biopolymer transport protein ExbD